MFYSIDEGQLLQLAMLAIPIHAVFFLLARKWHPLYLLAVILLVLAPFSIALDAAPVIVALKYARAYAGFLLVAIGILLLIGRRIPMGRASKVVLLASIVYWASGALAPDMQLGLINRSRYILLIAGGIFMGVSISSRAEMCSAIRVLFLGSLAWAVLVVVGIGLGHFDGGRLAMFGMNANQVGLTSGFAFLVSLTISLNDRRILLRGIAFMACGAIALGAVLTGSRAAVLGMGIGAVILMLPLFRRPLAFMSTALIAIVIGYVASGYLVSDFAVSRLATLDNTRELVWGKAMQYFWESPIYGHGEMGTGTGIFRYESTFDPHSIYLLVLVNTGILGGIVFLIAGLAALGQYVRAFRFAQGWAVPDRWPIYLAGAMFAAALTNGIFESAPLAGVTIYTLALGWATGLTDWVFSERSAPVQGYGVLPLSDNSMAYA